MAPYSIESKARVRLRRPGLPTGRAEGLRGSRRLKECARGCRARSREERRGRHTTGPNRAGPLSGPGGRRPGVVSATERGVSVPNAGKVSVLGLVIAVRGRLLREWGHVDQRMRVRSTRAGERARLYRRRPRPVREMVSGTRGSHGTGARLDARTRRAGNQPSKSKSRGGRCSNHRRSWSGVSWRNSGVSSSMSSSSSSWSPPSAASASSTMYSVVSPPWRPT